MHVFTVRDGQYVPNACTYRTNCQLQGIVKVCNHRNRCSVYSARRETRSYTTKRSVRYGCTHTHTHTVRNDRYVPNARVHRTKCSVVSELKYVQCKSNETPTWCNTVQVLFLQGHSTCFGRKRPSLGVCKHVEWPCRNKTCTVLHQVGVSFDLYYDARKHKIKIYAQCSVTRYNLSARVQRIKCLVRSRYVSTVQRSRYVLKPVYP